MFYICFKFRDEINYVVLCGKKRQISSQMGLKKSFWGTDVLCTTHHTCYFIINLVKYVEHLSSMSSSSNKSSLELSDDEESPNTHGRIHPRFLDVALVLASVQILLAYFFPLF